jgi:hypothetical protein
MLRLVTLLLAGNFGNTKGIIDSHDDVDAQVASESLWYGLAATNTFSAIDCCV